MSQKYRRYTLKLKDSKQILLNASEKLRMNLENMFGNKISLEIVEGEQVQILLFDGKPALFKIKDSYLPILNCQTILSQLPKAVVDMGAVRFVCNGADVMARGVVRYEGTFDKGDVIVVVDINHGKPLALGEALFNVEEAKMIKQGAVIETEHYVSDKIWSLAKTLAD